MSAPTPTIKAVKIGCQFRAGTFGGMTARSYARGGGGVSHQCKAHGGELRGLGESVILERPAYFRATASGCSTGVHWATSPMKPARRTGAIAITCPSLVPA